jgi:hypothetical protein
LHFDVSVRAFQLPKNQRYLGIYKRTKHTISQPTYVTGFTGWFKYHHIIFLVVDVRNAHNLISIGEYIA